MIYICTNAETIAHAVSLTREQDARCEAIEYDTNQVATNVADLADLSAVADELIDDPSAWTTERSFREWHGGRMVQFHKTHGALLAYDDESELADVRKLATAFEAHLSQLAELEIAELESITAREREQEAE